MRRPLAFPFAFAFALAGCHHATGVDNSPQFEAQESDFAAFTSWTSFQLPDGDPLSNIVYPAGTRVAFLNRRPPSGATHYPTGTIIVKAIQRGASPQDWEIFAIAKRGGDYDAAGAVGWEFFLLAIDPDGVPRVASRGIAPSDDGHGDMSPGPAAGGYFAGGGIAPCNVCHGQSSRGASDYTMSPLLAPQATAQ